MQQMATDWRAFATPANEAWAEAVRRFAKVSPLRTVRQFAEQEVVIPDGDYKGQLFRCHRQPAHGLWFDEIDSGRWSRFAFVACQQSGKTLAGFVIPIMYHAFEVQETVIVGLPTMDIARDKWEVDIKPAIEASRYADLLPKNGGGSRGGTPELITLRNGVNLKFMSGGGGDEKRSAFTSRVLVVTEADKLDEVGGQSDENTKLRQMEGRTRFFGNRKRVYLECTVSEETGRIWQEWMNGSAGLVHLPCHGCGDYVAPEREHFVGWQEATEEIDAEDSRFVCPSCGILWQEETRKAQLSKALVVHKGQHIECGRVVGDLPKTRTCGFRYSAATNAFADVAMIGVDEWKAKRAIDEDLAGRELLQWTWAWPPAPRVVDVEPLSVEAVEMRQHDLPRMIAPADTVRICAGVDARKEQLDWFVVAERASGTVVCIDFGYTTIDHNLPERTAYLQAVAKLRERFEYGYEVDQHSKHDRRPVDLAILDCHWNTDVLYESIFGVTSWMPSMGFGYKKHKATYNAPKQRSSTVTKLGDEWYFVETERSFSGKIRRFNVTHNNADAWKMRLHRALSVEPDHPHAMLLPKQSKPGTRRELAKQLTAEKQESVYEKGKGQVLKWVTMYHKNHWLDAAYMSLVAVSIQRQKQQQKQAQKPTRTLAEMAAGK
jgi:phage terminase large subunit GpA-like protein